MHRVVRSVDYENKVRPECNKDLLCSLNVMNHGIDTMQLSAGISIDSSGVCYFRNLL